MNGKSIQIDNTDAEGRLVLSGKLSTGVRWQLRTDRDPPDAIYYTATEYKPHTLIDVATLTG